MANNGLFQSDRFTVESERVQGATLDIVAFDSQLDRRVLIRAPSDQALRNPEMEREFAEEKRLLASIHSPYVLSVLHYHEKDEIGDRPYLIADWLPHSLTEVLAERRLDRLQALGIIGKLARGIAAIHTAGVTHCALSPDDIRISTDLADVRIASLGITLEAGVQHKTLQLPAKYAAPENYSVEVDGRADLYSLGMIAVECLLSKEDYLKLFAQVYADTNTQVVNTRWVHWHMDTGKAPPDLSQIDPSVPQECSQIVGRLLTKNRDNRYWEIAEVITELDAISPASAAAIKPIDINAIDPNNLPKTARKPGVFGIPIPVVVLLVLLSLGSAGYFSWLQYEAAQLDAAVFELAKRVVAKRDQLASAEPVLEFPDYIAGGESLGAAREAITEGEAQQAYDQLTLALAAYNRAEAALAAEVARVEALIPTKLGKLEDFIKTVTPTDANEFLAQVDGFRRSLNGGLTEQTYSEVEQRLSSLSQQMWWVLMRSPREFTAGSTEAELADALALCKQTSEVCAPEFYETEIARTVTLAPFAADLHEVSFGEFRLFAEETNYISTAEQMGHSYIVSGDQVVERVDGLSWRVPTVNGGAPNISDPVMHMSLEDASAYCAWAGGRLLSEDEWEYTARGPERRVYSWGNDWEQGRVARKPVNVSANADRRGFSNLTGNVWEWVTVPGLEVGGLKGGSWVEQSPANLRLAARRDPAPGVVSIDDGIRCGKSVETWPASLSSGAALD